jgi:hypothetical protein
MSSDCPICFDPITNINCTTTECGHTFHSCCIFKNLTQNNGCPLCRKELVQVEESESDSEEYESDEDTYDDYSDDDSEDDDSEDGGISVFQYTEALKRKGFTEYDFVKILLRQNVIDLSEKDKRGFELVNAISSIYSRKESVDYRDKRTYLDVVLGKDKIGETGIGPESIYLESSLDKKNKKVKFSL